VKGGGIARTDENAGADDAADAEEYEVPGPEGSLELAGLGLALNLRDALAHAHARKQSPFRSLGSHRQSPQMSCFLDRGA
jgi:hypothetical protein